jgi:hypothetical protein
MLLPSSCVRTQEETPKINKSWRHGHGKLGFLANSAHHVLVYKMLLKRFIGCGKPVAWFTPELITPMNMKTGGVEESKTWRGD